MADYRKLRVWVKADLLAKTSYALAKSTRQAGHSDLAKQIERAATSISSNIAEGSGYGSRKDFARFLGYSLGSSCELENQIVFAREIRVISYASGATTVESIEEIRKMLTGLIKKLDD